jgi:hypothetical protein
VRAPDFKLRMIHVSRLNAFLRSPKLMHGVLRQRARIIGLLYHLMAGFAPSANCPKQTHWVFKDLALKWRASFLKSRQACMSMLHAA